MKKASLALRIVALFFMLFALLTLLIPTRAYLSVGYWGSYYESLEVNFFQNMSALSDIGCGVGTSILFIISFLLALLFLVLSFPVKVFRRGYFSVFSLSSFFFALVITVEMCYTFFGNMNGVSVTYTTSLNLSFTSLLYFAVFTLLVVVGILEHIISRKRKAEIEAIHDPMYESQRADLGMAPTAKSEQNNPYAGQYGGYNAQNYAPYGGYAPQNNAAPTQNPQSIGGTYDPYTGEFRPNVDPNETFVPESALSAFESQEPEREHVDQSNQKLAQETVRPIANEYVPRSQSVPVAPVAAEPQPVPQPQPAPQPMSEQDRIMAEIEKYQHYYEKGVINEAQYNAKRNQLMRQLRAMESAN